KIIILFFFFQAEDGIRDRNVTGVQTCALPIYTLAADYNYGHISADWVKVFLRKAGGTLVNQEFIPLDVVNFDSVIKRVEGAKPDVVMSLLVGGNHIAFYRQFAATGLKGRIPIVSATFGLGDRKSTRLNSS